MPHHHLSTPNPGQPSPIVGGSTSFYTYTSLTSVIILTILGSYYQANQTISELLSAALSHR